MDACRLARELCENREVIILSERVLPRGHVSEISQEVRYFIFVVLHEVAHAVCKHRSPLFDSLTVKEVDAQEKEADDMAFAWFNDYVEERDNPNIQKISIEEIFDAKLRNQVIMEME